MPQKYLSVQGIATFVHHAGSTTLPEVMPDLRRGKAVVCVHGAGGNGAVFDDLRGKLAEAHSPVAFDQPAHGRSGEVDSLASIPKLAEFTKGVCDTLGAERPVLFGHSMGGAIAIEAAAGTALEPAALVLCGSGAHFDLPDEVLDELRQIVGGKARRQFRREAYSSATSPDVMRRGFMEDLKTDPRAALGDYLGLKAWDGRSKLAEIQAPTLVIVGEDEFPPLQAAADQLVDGIPNARKVVIPKAGHMVPLEQPAATADAVLEFLGELG